MMKLNSNAYGGYVRVDLVKGKTIKKHDNRKTKRVHVLVALTFLGERPHNQHVCHRDDVRSNNKLSNLRYDTAKNNGLDRIKNTKKKMLVNTILNGNDLFTMTIQF